MIPWNWTYVTQQELSWVLHYDCLANSKDFCYPIRFGAHQLRLNQAQPDGHQAQTNAQTSTVLGFHMLGAATSLAESVGHHTEVEGDPIARPTKFSDSGCHLGKCQGTLQKKNSLAPKFVLANSGKFIQSHSFAHSRLRFSIQYLPPPNISLLSANAYPQQSLTAPLSSLLMGNITSLGFSSFSLTPTRLLCVDAYRAFGLTEPQTKSATTSDFGQVGSRGPP
jgi:hypothetical protein